jgi:pimeloyl-ACP methyl ester carboxylesterase
LALIVFSAVILSTAFIFLSNSFGFVDKELTLVEKATGGEFCSSKTVTNFDAAAEEVDEEIYSHSLKKKTFAAPEVLYREKVIMVFDNIKYPCLKIENWDRDIYSNENKIYFLFKNSGYITVNNYRISLIVTRSNRFVQNKNNTIKSIFVRVPGGPGGTNIISNFDDVVNYNTDTMTLDFFYRGNGFNLTFPKPTFDIAVEDLKLFLKELRRRNKNAKITLVGESLGASLSAAALSELRFENDIIVNKAILFSPPFASLEETATQLEKLSHSLSKKERYALYRLRTEGKNGRDYGRLEYLDWHEVFRTFYTEEDGKIDLYDRLKAAIHTPVLVIYGSKDDRISIEKSLRFSTQKLDNVEIFVVDGMGHQFNRFLEAADIRAAVDAFLSQEVR